MDAIDPSAVPAEALRAPIHIGAVALRVRDLSRLIAYYCDVVGLSVQERTPRAAKLGVGGVTLLELYGAPEAPPGDPRAAGLYHTAFLMPTRADLARWLVHMARRRVPIAGASDHDVSEAIYLDDPEGNGIEVYSDRPSERWRRDGQVIFQKTEPLDMDAILREIDPAAATYSRAPEGLRIGHVHLRVGDIAQAEAFYHRALGLDVTRRRTGATFLSSGGYHHHIAVNVWQSHGALRRDDGRTGLAWFDIEIGDRVVLDATMRRLREAGVAVEAGAQGFEASDPWGTRIRFGIASHV